MLKLTFIGLLLLSYEAYGSPESETILENNLKEIKSVMDSTQNPCVDFIKYACGNLKDKPENKSVYPYSYEDTEIALLFLEDNNITSKTALKVKDYFQSCVLAKPHDINCYDAILLTFGPVMMSEFYHLYYTEEDHKINVGILEEFFKSYDQIKANYEHPKTYSVKHAENLRTEINNMKDKLNRENIEKDYNSIVIDKTNFERNTEKLINLYAENLEENNNKLKELYGPLIDPDVRSKPLYFHYVQKSYDRWWDFFFEHKLKFQYDEVIECAKNQSKIVQVKLPESVYGVYGVPVPLAALMQTFRNFETVLKSTENYDEIYKKYDLTPQKSFFLSAAQVKCSLKLAEANDELYLVLLNIDEFYQTFGCPNTKCFNVS